MTKIAKYDKKLINTSCHFVDAKDELLGDSATHRNIHLS